jgi:hypothetical protein
LLLLVWWIRMLFSPVFLFALWVSRSRLCAGWGQKEKSMLPVFSSPGICAHHQLFTSIVGTRRVLRRGHQIKLQETACKLRMFKLMASSRARQSTLNQGSRSDSPQSLAPHLDDKVFATAMHAPADPGRLLCIWSFPYSVPAISIDGNHIDDLSSPAKVQLHRAPLARAQIPFVCRYFPSRRHHPQQRCARLRHLHTRSPRCEYQSDHLPRSDQLPHRALRSPALRY